MHARAKIAVCLTGFFIIIGGAAGQNKLPRPGLGYVYPAGGRAGDTFTAVAGGQFLKNASGIIVSGDGVNVEIIEHGRAFINLDKDQRELLKYKMAEAWENNLSRLPAEQRKSLEKLRKTLLGSDNSRDMKSKKPDKEGVEIPKHHLLVKLGEKNIRELLHVKSILTDFRGKTQQNRQLGETLLLKVSINPDAVPGFREMRVQTDLGLTSPVKFHVGSVPETCELEPNGIPKPWQKRLEFPEDDILDVPAMLNGQIMPGDIDRFRFRAGKGMKLVISAHARRLIPYLADAVPGWFQAVLTLRDSEGKELAYADDFRFDPDPVIYCEISDTGIYEVEIRDSIYRGREDFVYRIQIAESPRLTSIFPLGGKAGTDAEVSVSGWNLPKKKIKLDTRGERRIKQITSVAGTPLPVPIPYALDTLPEYLEVEINDSQKNAQKIVLPVILNGRISSEGDSDCFSFNAKKAEVIVAEVIARRLNSPIDSLLRLLDSSGRVVAVNDDYFVKDKHLHKDKTGLQTHYADSYLRTEIPEDGVYFLQISDTQCHYGDAYAYRLRISSPRPDFSLRVSPSSLCLRSGGSVPVEVYALREDGYDGPVRIELVHPETFSVQPGIIPRGCSRIAMVISAPKKIPAEPFTLELKGIAEINGKSVERPAVPADDVMQAFLYRHLVTAENLLVAPIKRGRRIPEMRLETETPLKIVPGRDVEVRIKTGKHPVFKDVLFQAVNPQKGLSIAGFKHDGSETMSFQISADNDIQENDSVKNLVLETLIQVTPKRGNSKSPGKKRTWPLGFYIPVPYSVERGVNP